MASYKIFAADERKTARNGERKPTRKIEIEPLG
jgi:hypothetical protein